MPPSGSEMVLGQWILLGVIGTVAVGFIGWICYAIRNRDYLAKIQEAWAPSDEYHTS